MFSPVQKNPTGNPGGIQSTSLLLLLDNSETLSEYHTKLIPARYTLSTFRLSESTRTELKIALPCLQALVRCCNSPRLILTSHTELFKLLSGETTTKQAFGKVWPICPDLKIPSKNVVLVPKLRIMQLDLQGDTLFDVTRQTIATCLSNQPRPSPLDQATIRIPLDEEELEQTLQTLLLEPSLAIDIETTSLDSETAQLVSVVLAESTTQAVFFPVHHSESTMNPVKVETLLRDFLFRYENRQIYHNAAFDVKILVRRLFMQDQADIPGMLKYTRHLFRNLDDTYLMSYLATNNAYHNDLSLKAQAISFAGNWILEDMHDLQSKPLSKLCDYNVLDGLATQWVHAKHLQATGEQSGIYEILLQAQRNVVIKELTGMPASKQRIRKALQDTEQTKTDTLNRLLGSPVIEEFTRTLRQEALDKANAKLKKKVKTLDDIHIQFNPRSGPQIQKLLYQHLELPVLYYTKKKNPAVDKEALDALIHWLTEQYQLG